MKRFLLIVTALLMLGAQAVYASDNETDNATVDVRPAERFGRGVVNIISSPLELPAQMYTRALYYEETKESFLAIIGGFIEGIPMGALVYFPWRLAAGVYDFFTFPFSRCNRCIIYPPYVPFTTEFLEKDHTIFRQQ